MWPIALLTHPKAPIRFTRKDTITMAVTRQQAKKLCTVNEMKLVDASLRSHNKGMTSARLRQKIKLARELRDKYRSLAQRQRREVRGKQKPRGSRPAMGNQNTKLKMELFAETMARFEAKLKEVSQSDAAGTKSTKKKKSARPATKGMATKLTKKATKKGKRVAKAADKAADKAGVSEATQAAAKKAAGIAKIARKAGKRLSKTAKRTGKDLTAIASDAASELVPRQKRRKRKSMTSKIGREANRFAKSAVTRIQGHVKGQTRRRQARRDSR